MTKNTTKFNNEEMNENEPLISIIILNYKIINILKSSNKLNSIF